MTSKLIIDANFTAASQKNLWSCSEHKQYDFLQHQLSLIGQYVDGRGLKSI